MKKVYLALFLVSAFIGSSITVLGQKVLFPEINPINGRFDNFLIRGGAANQTSTSIIFDSKGFLWSGTETALYRFDGTSYIEYRNSEDDSSGYSGNNILTLYEDREGLIWVGTVGALNRLDPASGRFRHYHPDPSGDPPVNNMVRLIREDPGNNLLWIITNGNVFSFDKSTEEFTEYGTHPSAWLDEWNVFWEPPNKFLIDRDKNKWFATRYGLYCFRNHDNKFLAVFPDSSVKWESENASVVCVCEDLSGTIWFGTNRGSLLRIRPGAERPEKVDFTRDSNNVQGFYSIGTIKADAAGRIWLFGDKAFSVYDPALESSVTYRISFARNDRYRLSDSEILINQAFITADSMVWFLSQALGIMYRFDPRTEKLTLYRVPAFIVHKVIMDKTGAFWFGCIRNNIYRLTVSNVPYSSVIVNNSSWTGVASHSKMTSDHTGQIWMSIREGTCVLRTPDNYSSPGIERISSIGRDSVFASVFMDSRNRLWFGGREGQVVCKYPFTDKVIRYQLDHSSMDIRNDAVRKIQEDPEGNIWAVAVSCGLYRFSNSTGKFDHILDYRDLPGRKNPELSDFLAGNNGEFWMLNYKGICQLRIPGSIIKSYPGTESKNTPEAGDYARIRKDLTGNIWLLHSLKGVLRYNRETDSFSQVPISNDLAGVSYFDLVTDSLNRLWIAHSKGITVFNPAVNTCRTINIPRLQYDVQGYPVPGHMVYINENRLFIFNLDIPVNNTIPEIYLTGLKINGEDHNKFLSTTEDIRSLRKITLKHINNSLRIDFSAISYIDPASNTYRYFMKGLDNDTVYSGTTNYTEYKKLRSGRYIFWVTGANNDGLWNKEGITLEIKIESPFYATFMAYLIYFLISVLLISTYIRLRINSVKRENIRLEALVNKRTEELEIRNRQLEAADKMKTKFFTDISHEIRTPLSLMLGPLEYLTTETHFDNKTDNLLDMIKRNGQRLMQLVAQMLDISRLDSGRMKLFLAEADIIAFLRLHVYEYLSLAESRNIEYMVELPENVHITFFDEDKLEKIIMNLLSNAFKFTAPGGNVSCIVNIIPGANMPDNLVIRVVDSGEGIDNEDIEKIFDRFYRIENNKESVRNGTGIGLSLTRELLEICHGSIKVSSQKGKGSIFDITIPLGKDHLSPEEYKIITLQPYKAENHEIKRWREIDAVADKDDQDTESFRILVVEDNDDLRKYITENLANDYLVINTSMGKSGINLAFTVIPDLVITDVIMKDIDGFTLCERLKGDERTSHIPILILTAKATGEDRIKGLKVGADDYMVKPFSMAELKARIANLLAQREQLRLKYSNILGIKLEKNEKESVDERFMRKVVSIVNENIRDFNFNVRSLHVQLGMSRTHLHRKLKVLTGVSPVVLIRNIRLEKAALLLKNKSGNVVEIANSVGISNPSYFTKCFREYFGVLPKDFQAETTSRNKGNEPSL